jgi:starch synthase
VSPTYAQEIQTAPLGMGLEGLLQARADRLHGILNGVDYHEWDPAHDRYLPACYTTDDLSGKARNKRSLQKELGLPQSPRQPLLAFVGRMVEQKGIDLILDACTPLLAAKQIQLVLVGTGQAGFEAAASALADAYPKQCCARIAYDEGLAHRVEAGADLFLMPSRFEPCGMNQMYSLRYGTPPIVHATGGLADTVVAFGSTTGPKTAPTTAATGFSFTPATSAALSGAIAQALDLYRDPNRSLWLQLIRNGMRADFSWNQSARLYLELYRNLLTPQA